ncbi:DNA-binding protein [Lysinibacillus sp. SGAir0095]|uniref:DNA-binding protein n=1 Tax=Lysinibacillus sp. SGAir0095 TaxID=2070463 RepID=UPI0010CD1A1B|nr:DNA-binding protein [Lysinibacillus sp. SGAir0095]QCR33586.1 DNA-binding protein [Lysinibacillus sp. SGAir0095]
MKVELNLIPELENQLKSLVINAIKDAITEKEEKMLNREWMSLKEGANYAGVSYNSFIKFRKMGLAICEIEGIKRVSKKEIDIFLHKNSF